VRVREKAQERITPRKVTDRKKENPKEDETHEGYGSIYWCKKPYLGRRQLQGTKP
jgi:hypothetical protein